MKRIDSHTVEFTANEMKVHEWFHQALDLGLDIINAARSALTDALDDGMNPSAEFVEYLSEDTVLVTEGRKVVLTSKGRRLTEEPTPA